MVNAFNDQYLNLKTQRKPNTSKEEDDREMNVALTFCTCYKVCTLGLKCISLFLKHHRAVRVLVLMSQHVP